MFEENKDNNENNNYENFGYKDEEEVTVSLSYTNRMLQKKRLERKQRKGNVWISRLHILVRLIILVGIVFLLYKIINSPQWYVDKNIFTTSNPNLEILNNDIVPTYKILNELRTISVLDEPIYKFETAKIRMKLLELEPIEDIYIRRFWFPARLQIIVKERTPLISIHTSTDSPVISFFTADGVLIGGDYLPLPSTKQTIKVIAGGDFREWDKTKVDEIYSLTKAVEQLTKEKVECLNLTNVNDIYVKIPSVLLRIGTYDENVFDRISKVSSILPKLKEVSKPVKYIDLRWKNAAFIKTE